MKIPVRLTPKILWRPCSEILPQFHGSCNDLFALPKPANSAFYFTWEAGSPVQAENERMASILGAETMQLEADADLDSCQVSLPAAVRWLLKP